MAVKELNGKIFFPFKIDRFTEERQDKLDKIASSPLKTNIYG